MAKETVIEYETVERQETVTWCDVCGANCTDAEHYVVREVCYDCSDELQGASAFISGSKNYAEQWVENLTDKQARTVIKVFNVSQILFATAIASFFIGLSSMLLHRGPNVVVTSADFVVMAIVVGIVLSVLGYLLD